MNAENVLKLLLANNYEELERQARQEITLKSQDKSGKDVIKARIAYSKVAHKKYCNMKPTMAGAYMHNDKQVICDGYTCAVYDTPVEGCVNATFREGSMFNPDPVFHGLFDASEEFRIKDFGDITATYKLYREDFKARKGRYPKQTDGNEAFFVVFGNSYMNYEYLKNVYETLQLPVLTVYRNVWLLQGQNGKAVCCETKLHDVIPTSERIYKIGE